MNNKFNLKVLNLNRKRKKYIDFMLEFEPESKKAMGKEKKVVQQQIINEMKKWGFEKLHSNIALDVVVCTSDKCACTPQVHRFAKNLMDLLHKKEGLEDINDEKFLPFEDDRNIKYLSIKYIFTPEPSLIFIRIRPFSSFISDLHFIDNEIREIESDDDDIQSARCEYDDLVNNKSKYIKLCSNEGYNERLNWAIFDLQKILTRHLGISPFIIKLLYPPKGVPLDIVNEYQHWAKMMLDIPIRIRLPEVPTKHGTSKEYKTEIAKQLSQYIKSHPILNPLQAPVIVAVFHYPPINKKGFYIDLDNIMLTYVLPAFNSFFTPPLSLMNVHKRKDSNAIPKSLSDCAIGYEIIELPRGFSQEKGFLSIGFRFADNEKSVIEWTSEKIDQYIKENKYLD